MQKPPKAIDSLTKNVEKVCFLISEASGVVNIFLSQPIALSEDSDSVGVDST